MNCVSTSAGMEALLLDKAIEWSLVFQKDAFAIERGFGSSIRFRIAKTAAVVQKWVWERFGMAETILKAN